MSENNTTPVQYRVPEDYPSIQAAIDAIPTNGSGVINVASGTFPSRLLIADKKVFLNGQSQQATILDGEGKHTVCRVLGGTLHLWNVTVRNGKSIQGGGFLILDSTVSIGKTTIADNIANYGGGFYVRKSHVHLNKVKIMRNMALDGGGLRSWDSYVEAKQTSIQQNYAELGSGVYCYDTRLGFDMVSVAENGSLEKEESRKSLVEMADADPGYVPLCQEGGGIWMCNTTYTFNKVRIAENLAVKGGGWYREESRATDVTNLCVQDNFRDQCFERGAGKEIQ